MLPITPLHPGTILKILMLAGCLAGCRPGEPPGPGEVQSGLIHPVRVVPAGEPRITLVNPDSLTTFSVKGRTFYTEPPVITPANANVQPAGAPTAIPMPDSLTVVTPGENGVPLPKSQSVSGRRSPARHPRPVSALPPAFRDNAVIDVRYVDQDQGLSASTLLAIEEDRRGNLWFGTVGGGVSRYDGSRFFHYTLKEGLASMQIFDILEDSRGQLWFANADGGGVTRYDGTTFTHFAAEEGLTTNVVYDILEDKQGRFWMATDGAGVVMYDGRSFTYFTEKEGLADDTVFYILEDSRGHLWFSTEEGGLCHYDGRRFTHFGNLQESQNTLISPKLEDSRGNLWFTTTSGYLLKYDGIHFWRFPRAPDWRSRIVQSIAEDDPGDLWLGTRGAGVCRFDGRHFTYYSTEEGLNSNAILAVKIDGRGTIWMGTEGGGAVKLIPGSFQHFGPDQGLGVNPVRTILEDSNGHLWMGNRAGELIKYDGSRFFRYTLIKGRDRRVISAIEDRQGNIWLGSFGEGLLRIEPKEGSGALRGTQYARPQGLPSHDAELIMEDSRGDIWMGTFEGGLMKFNGKVFTHFTEKDGIGANSVISLLEDSRGNLWFGTYGGGVTRFDGERFAVFTEAEGLSHNIVRTIFEDRQGNLWFGAEGGGLTMYDGKYFAHYQLDERRGAAVIRSIQEDPDGNFWFATMNGLYYAQFEPGDSPAGDQTSRTGNPPLARVVRFDRTDGLKGLDFLQNSVCLDRNNQLWWGTEKSLTTLHLDRFRLAGRPPRVQLTGVLLNQNFIDFQDTEEAGRRQLQMDACAPFYNYPLNLALPHFANSLTFQYSAIDRAAPRKVTYRHFLKGYDKTWSAPTAANEVEYRNLPHGEYSFQVMARGEAGRWSDPVVYHFLIYPPWWQTWWAYAFYGLLIFGILYLIRRYELKRRQIRHQKEIERARLEEKSKQADKIEAQARELQKSNRELQAKNAEILKTRDQLIAQEKLASLGHLTAGIAHEIKNPLNIINNFAEGSSELAEELSDHMRKIEDRLDPSTYREILEIIAYFKENVGYIEEGGHEADRIVRSMMDHARETETSRQEVNINDLLDENANLAYHSYRALDASFAVDIQKDYAPSLPRANVLPQHLGRAFLNILNNACYAVNQKRKEPGNESYQPHICLTTRPTETGVEISIRDNGPGIPDDIRKEIFTPFFTTKPTGQGNIGLGLSISYDIVVKTHRGTLEVESEPGAYTEFLIGLPGAPAGLM
jgi:ligand-binding sensor domain-containing protein/signal transduction histidine kinase